MEFIEPTDKDTLREVMGTVLRELRERRGISQVEVASKIGRTASWLSMLESGKTTTTLDLLVDLLKYYGCQLSDFFQLVEEKNRNISDPSKNIAITKKHEWQSLEIVTGVIYMLPPLSGRLHEGKLEITPVIFKPKSATGIVKHPGEELFHVIENEILIKLETEPGPRRLKKGDSVHFFSSIGHNVSNETDNDTKLLVIRSPKRFP